MGHLFKRTSLFLILVPIMIFVFTLQSCHEPTNPEIIDDGQNNFSTVNFSKATVQANIQKIAKGLSILLKDEKNRLILQNEISSSKKTEQILEATEFLKTGKNIYVNGVAKNTTFASSILEMFTGKENEELKDFIDNLPFGLVDIYFPLKKYREQWKNQDDLLIAYVCRDKSDKSDIPAYDLNGNQVALSYDKAPDTPTLVIYPSEKNRNYYLYNENKNFDDILKKNSSLSSVNSDDPPPVYTYHWRIEEFKISHNFDPWPSGMMEIYFKVWYKHNGNWSNVYIPFNIIDGVTAGMWHGVPIGWNAYNSTDLNDHIKFEVWESDGFLTDDDFVADATWDKVIRLPDGYPIWGSDVVEFPYTLTNHQAVDSPDSEPDYVEFRDYRTN